MTLRESPPPPGQAAIDRRTSFFLFIAVCVGTASLASLLEGLAWWFVVALNAAIVLAAPAFARWATKRAWMPPVAAFAASLAVVTLFFAADTAIIGVIPTPETLGRFAELSALGQAGIATQGIPAQATTGIVFLMCVGVSAIAIAMEACAFWLRAPALVGIPLLVLVAVPSLVDPDLNDPFFFALTAGSYLAVLLITSRRPVTRAASTLAAVSIVGSLLMPIALPAVNAQASTGPSDIVTTGVNPIIDLGDDLRRNKPALAATYTTDAVNGVYLKLSTLDDFSGREWAPATIETDPANDVSSIGPPPGLTDGIAALEVKTEVEVGNIRGRWLPVPYAATSIVGLTGTWNWESEGLGVRSEESNMRGQTYEVTSLSIRPNSDQMSASGTAVEPGMERYLQLPEEMPGVVATTAAEIVGNATTNYERAMLLQAFFRDGDFVYSEEAPVEGGFDGSGAEVLGAFLEAKTGYCVHFASGMAAMARTLGIPSRVVVGFTPGSLVETGTGSAPVPVPVPDAGPQEYRVSTDDLHAWPELYFPEIGWVQFEATPGRGLTPDFTPAPVDDPATPDVDESIPTATPTTGPTNTPTGLPIDEETPVDPGAAASTGSPIPWYFGSAFAALLALLLPWAVRAARRFSRMALLARGGLSVAGWDELRDTARDLGFIVRETSTPRVFAADLLRQLDGDGFEPLSRLREAVEFESFAGRQANVSPRDVAEISAALRRAADPRDRLFASLLPRSLFVRWLPALAREG